MAGSLPRTGIPGPVGLTTDGLLGGGATIAILGLSVAESGDDGGWEIVAQGVFPTATPLVVTLTDGTTEWVCYSGIAGQGADCYSPDGSTLTFVHPPMPLGTYAIEITDGVLTGILADALDIVKRTYVSNLYALRRHAPPPRAVGPYDVQDETTIGKVRGLLEATFTALADTVYEFTGRAIGRLEAAVTPGDATLGIRETHRWPDAGRFVLNGVRGRYTGRTPTTLTGITADDGVSPFTGSSGPADPVMLISTQGALDRARDSYFLDTVEGPDLNVYGSNVGIPRPWGLTDTQYRALLVAATYLDAGTIYAIELVLEAIRPGGWTVWENLLAYPNVVFVGLSAFGTDSYRGKTFLIGLEPQARLTPTTVQVDYEPTVVSGIWDAADPYREGTNYAEATIPVVKAAPNQLVNGAGWGASDVGRSVVLSDGELWLVLAQLDALTVQVGRDNRTDGELNPGLPDRVGVQTSFFRPWMVGHTIVVSGVLNGGAYPIVAWISETSVQVDVSGHPSGGFLLETGAAWTLRPAFTAAAVDATILRATFAGDVITAPQTLPADVLVDYGTVPSAQILKDPDVDGNPQFPAYLYDDTDVVKRVLDVLTVAGVEAIVETV